VPVGNAQGDLVTSWLNPVSLLAGVLAVAFSGYLAAVYLAADAHRLAEPTLERDFRARALTAGVVAGALALAGLLVVRAEARPLWNGLTTGVGLAMVCLCALAGMVTLALVWRTRYGPARATAALAVATVIAGWAAAQYPRLLPGMTVSQAAADRATLVATIVGVAVGAAVLVPSLALLYTLVLRGRLDTAVVAAGAGARPGPALRAGRARRAGRTTWVRRPEAAAGRRIPVASRASRAGLAGAFAVASLAAGVGLLVFADPAWTHGLGAVSLIACAVTVFALISEPPGKT
jgi:cytochrome bd ubiquinol oxidase subunit II